MANKTNKIRTKKRKQSGGNLPGGFPDSSWGWGISVSGNGWQQFMNTLTTPPSQGNALPGTVGPVPPVAPQPPTSINNKSGGKRRKQINNKRRKSVKKGGYLGAALNQAIVPLTLLGLQQSNFTKKYRKTK